MAIDGKELIEHRIDYERVSGKRCSHFVCPITLQAGGELINGHIVPQSIHGATRQTVIQRKDVDSFFGRRIEPHLVRKLNLQSCEPHELITGADRDKLFAIDPTGRRFPIFKASGDPSKVPFPKVILRDGTGREFGTFFVKARHEEIQGLKLEPFASITMSNPAIIGSFVKAGYLALFRMLGYRYVFQRTTDFVRSHLASFFLGQETAAQAFRYFKGSCKALFTTNEGEVLRDTLRHNFVIHNCHMGRLFGYTVLFRVASRIFTITLPADDGDYIVPLSLYRRWLVQKDIDPDLYLATFDGQDWVIEEGPIRLPAAAAPQPGQLRIGVGTDGVWE